MIFNPHPQNSCFVYKNSYNALYRSHMYSNRIVHALHIVVVHKRRRTEQGQKNIGYVFIVERSL